MITRVEIKNYKSIGDVSLDLGPLTVLVGENGSGKSNFVEALRFVSDVTLEVPAAAFETRGGSILALRRRVPEEASSMAFGVESRSGSDIASYAFRLGCADDGSNPVEHERLTASGLVHPIERRAGDVVVQPPDTSLGGIAVVNDVLAIPRLAKWLPTCLFDELARVRAYAVSPSTLREPKKRAPTRLMDRDGRNLASVLQTVLAPVSGPSTELCEALARMVPDVRSVRVSEAESFLVVVVEHGLDGRREAVSFDLSEESDGTIRLLALLTALYQEPAPSLIAIEEPELYVHPGAMGVLCDEIRAASHRTQVLITTHSPDILDRFKPEEIRVVEKHGGVTEIGPVSKEQVEAVRERLLAPGELMVAEGLRMQRGKS